MKLCDRLSPFVIGFWSILYCGTLTVIEAPPTRTCRPNQTCYTGTHLTVSNKASIWPQEVEVHDGTLRSGVLKVGVTVEHTHWSPRAMPHLQHAVVHVSACEVG